MRKILVRPHHFKIGQELVRDLQEVGDRLRELKSTFRASFGDVLPNVYLTCFGQPARHLCHLVLISIM